jgi:hypothetical protein
MTLTPLSCQLMGWRGSDPGGYANNGAHWFCGGLLLFVGGLLEFFLAHTFAFVVYCAYGMLKSRPFPPRSIQLLTFPRRLLPRPWRDPNTRIQRRCAV